MLCYVSARATRIKKKKKKEKKKKENRITPRETEKDDTREKSGAAPVK